jgi:hypothetical protein
LHFDWKWPPPAVQPHHSHEDGGHCFSELSDHLCIDARGGGFLWYHFSEGPLYTGAWIRSRLLSHSEALLYERCSFWNLRRLAVKVGSMEICDNLTFP